MARKKKPTLRYFARFKEDFGYLRAVIRNGSTRKYVLTPLVITADQLARLDTSGHINQPQGDTDYLLEGRLREYTTYIWQTVNPLLESGEFDAMPSEHLTTAILNTKKAEEARREKELEEQAEEEFRRQAEFAKRYGVTLNRHSQAEFAKLQEKLTAELTPEQYAEIWATPQWKKDYIEEQRQAYLNRHKGTGAEEGEPDGER